MSLAAGPSARIPAAFRRRETVVASPNERRILEFVRRQGVTSRADLTRATDLAPQSVSRLVEALSARGLLKFGTRRNIGRGQPSLDVTLDPYAAFSAGISVTTERTSTALIALDGAVLAERDLNVPGMAVEDVIAAVRATLQALFTELRLEPRRLFGLGLAMPGFFTGESNRMNPPDPLAHWSRTDLDQMFMRGLDLPVWLENDGSASAIGESLYGVGQSHPSFAYLYFTYGFGGGLVEDGRLVRGRRGNAGEFSAMLPPERHNDRPTLELLRAMLMTRGVGLDSLSELETRFDPDWPGVDEWIARVKRPLCDIVSAISAVADPSAVVFGGQIPKALAERLIGEVEFYNRTRRGEPRPTPELLVSSIQGDAAAIGAAAMPFKHAFFS